MSWCHTAKWDTQSILKYADYSYNIACIIRSNCFVAWLSWEPWQPCSVTCGKGTESRTRRCSTGNPCRGSPRETRECVKESCPSKYIKSMY